jgi:hypothetical protein
LLGGTIAREPISLIVELALKYATKAGISMLDIKNKIELIER